MTARKRLLTHIYSEHYHQPRGGLSFAQLGRWHSDQHHRYVIAHDHAGPNTGPNDRPPGWKTGEGSIPRS